MKNLYFFYSGRHSDKKIYIRAKQLHVTQTNCQKQFPISLMSIANLTQLFRTGASRALHVDVLTGKAKFKPNPSFAIMTIVHSDRRSIRNKRPAKCEPQSVVSASSSAEVSAIDTTSAFIQLL